MILEEAIERNKVIKQKLIANTNPKLTDIDWAGALQLGIEALERQANLFNMVSRGEAIENIIQLICEPLPSETEETT